MVGCLLLPFLLACQSHIDSPSSGKIVLLSSVHDVISTMEQILTKSDLLSLHLDGEMLTFERSVLSVL